MRGLNALFAATNFATGRRLDPIVSYNYWVEIDGLLTGGFSQVEGLGGPRQQLGATTWNNIVLTHGVVEIDTLWNWYEATARGIIKRKNGTIVLLDRKMVPVSLWNFRAGLPVVWTGPALDAGSGQVAVERVEIAHRGLEKPNWVRAITALRGMARLATGRESVW